jgi:hypothetical protein
MMAAPKLGNWEPGNLGNFPVVFLPTVGKGGQRVASHIPDIEDISHLNINADAIDTPSHFSHESNAGPCHTDNTAPA